MSEMDQVSKQLDYIIRRVDEIAQNGCAKAPGHDATAIEVVAMKAALNRFYGALWAIGGLGPIASGLIVWANRLSAKDIVDQVLTKLAGG